MWRDGFFSCEFTAIQFKTPGSLSELVPDQDRYILACTQFLSEKGTVVLEAALIKDTSGRLKYFLAWDQWYNTLLKRKTSQ